MPDEKDNMGMFLSKASNEADLKDLRGLFSFRIS